MLKLVSSRGNSILPKQEGCLAVARKQTIKETVFSFDDLSQVFAYDPKTGVLTWRVKPCKNIAVGAEAGGVIMTRKADAKLRVSYRYVAYKGHHFQGARLAWLLGRGEWPSRQVSVKDKNPLNLAYDNLQLQNTVEGEFASRSEYHAAYTRENRATRKAQEMRRTFDISPAQYAAMLAIQDNKCAICGREGTELRHGRRVALHVDHNHETGQIRQLLCGSCNLVLGKMQEDPARLRAAADYIERHRARKKETA